MSIYHYGWLRDGKLGTVSSHKHPSARNIRVVVSVAGQARQKYFRSDQIDEAKAWEAEQLAEQEKVWDEFHQNRYFKPKTPGGTRVKGMRMYIRLPYGRSQVDYYRCQIGVELNNSYYGNLLRKRIVSQDNLESQWKALCKILANHMGKKRTPSEWIKACPTHADFKEFIRYKKSQGQPIPFSRLPKNYG